MFCTYCKEKLCFFCLFLLIFDNFHFFLTFFIIILSIFHDFSVLFLSIFPFLGFHLKNLL